MIYRGNHALRKEQRQLKFKKIAIFKKSRSN
jgi:hypothetical protein